MVSCLPLEPHDVCHSRHFCHSSSFCHTLSAFLLFYSLLPILIHIPSCAAASFSTPNTAAPLPPCFHLPTSPPSLLPASIPQPNSPLNLTVSLSFFPLFPFLSTSLFSCPHASHPLSLQTQQHNSHHALSSPSSSPPNSLPSSLPHSLSLPTVSLALLHSIRHRGILRG